MAASRMLVLIFAAVGGVSAGLGVFGFDGRAVAFLSVGGRVFALRFDAAADFGGRALDDAVFFFAVVAICVFLSELALLITRQHDN